MKFDEEEREAFFEAVYGGEPEEDRRLDLIMDHFDDAHRMGEFAYSNQTLIELDPLKMDFGGIHGVVAITRPASHSLPDRLAFIHRAIKRKNLTEKEQELLFEML